MYPHVVKPPPPTTPPRSVPIPIPSCCVFPPSPPLPRSNSPPIIFRLRSASDRDALRRDHSRALLNTKTPASTTLPHSNPQPTKSSPPPSPLPSSRAGSRCTNHTSCVRPLGTRVADLKSMSNCFTLKYPPPPPNIHIHIHNSTNARLGSARLCTVSS